MSSPAIPVVRIWDLTNYMPTMDADARRGYVSITDGTRSADVKAASTAPATTDKALVVAISPNTPALSFTISKAATSTLTGVAASATSVTLAAANTNRLGVIITNDTTSATLYVKLGTTATTASGGYTQFLPPGSSWEVPFNYTGRIDGIWSAATGFAQVDELTA